MANRIKGITVEIGGDTTGLDKALKSVNSSITKTQFGGIRWSIEYLPPSDHRRDCGGSGSHCRDHCHHPKLGSDYRVVWVPLEHHLYRDRHHDRERENVVFQPLDTPAECLERHLQRGADGCDAARFHYPRGRGHHHTAVSVYLGEL